MDVKSIMQVQRNYLLHYIMQARQSAYILQCSAQFYQCADDSIPPTIASCRMDPPHYLYKNITYNRDQQQIHTTSQLHVHYNSQIFTTSSSSSSSIIIIIIVIISSSKTLIMTLYLFFRRGITTSWPEQ